MKDYSRLDQSGKENNKIDHINILFNDNNLSFKNENKKNNESISLSKSYSFSKKKEIKFDQSQEMNEYLNYLKNYRDKIIERNNRYIKQISKRIFKRKINFYLPPLPNKIRSFQKPQNFNTISKFEDNKKIKNENININKKKWNYSSNSLIKEKIYYLGKSNLLFNPIVSPKSSYFFDMKKMK